MTLLTPGTITQDRYRIVQLMGQGGMGAVYEAQDLRLRNRVALKQMLVSGEYLSQAFEREAQLLANLRYPTLPRVIDHFTDATGQFLVMEFFPGEDLAQMLTQRSAPFPIDQVLGWADQLLGTLQYLHMRQPPVIHRDIKPQNMKLLSPDEVILLDFGLAKGSNIQMSRITTGGSIVGYTPQFAPLEQIQGSGTDPRSDLYSLAATVHSFLTGKPPADALARATAMVSSRPDPLLPVHQLNPAVPLAISEILTQALALNIELRPPNAAVMRKALNDVRQASVLPGDQAAWVEPVSTSSTPAADRAAPSATREDATEIEATPAVAQASLAAANEAPPAKPPTEPTVVEEQVSHRLEVPTSKPVQPSVQAATVADPPQTSEYLLPTPATTPVVESDVGDAGAASRSVPVSVATSVEPNVVAQPERVIEQRPTSRATQRLSPETVLDEQTANVPIPIAPKRNVEQVAVSTPAIGVGRPTGRRNIWLGLGALLLLIVGGGGFFLLQQNRQAALTAQNNPTGTAQAVAALVPTTTVRVASPTSEATATPETSPTSEATPTPEASPTVSVMTVDRVADELRPATVLLNVKFAETALDNAYTGGGTGIVYDLANGYIVTNAHVVEGAASLEVVLANQTRGRPAQVIGRSQCDDLAVLKVSDTRDLGEATIGDSNTTKVGTDVVALGYPNAADVGTDLTVTNGTISKLNATFGAYQNLLQTNAAINEGSSGGPLVNRRGEVIGINTAYSNVGGERQEGINYAIAVSEAHSIVEQLQQGNNVLFTGMNLYANTFSDYFGTEAGVVVVGIASGSPASQIGVQPADLLYRIEGTPVNSQADVCRILRSHGDGDQIKLTFLRGKLDGGQLLEGELTIGKPVAGSNPPKLAVVGPSYSGTAPTYVSTTAGAQPTESGSSSDDYNVLVQSDFEGADDNWDTGENDDIKAEIANGVYKIDVKLPKVAYALTTDKSDGMTNSFVLADVTISGDTRGWAGLTLHYTKTDAAQTMYVCLINNSGRYLCSKLNNASGTPLAQGSSDAIKKNGSNQLVMAVVGDELAFFVNDQEVASFKDPAYKSGKAGLYVEAADKAFTAQFDNVSIGTPK